MRLTLSLWRKWIPIDFNHWCYYNTTNQSKHCFCPSLLSYIYTLIRFWFALRFITVSLFIFTGSRWSSCFASCTAPQKIKYLASFWVLFPVLLSLKRCTAEQECCELQQFPGITSLSKSSLKLSMKVDNHKVSVFYMHFSVLLDVSYWNKPVRL